LVAPPNDQASLGRAGLICKAGDARCEHNSGPIDDSRHLGGAVIEPGLLVAGTGPRPVAQHEASHCKQATTQSVRMAWATVSMTHHSTSGGWCTQGCAGGCPCAAAAVRSPTGGRACDAHMVAGGGGGAPQGHMPGCVLCRSLDGNPAGCCCCRQAQAPCAPAANTLLCPAALVILVCWVSVWLPQQLLMLLLLHSGRCCCCSLTLLGRVGLHRLGALAELVGATIRAVAGCAHERV
jgi:hypothetical protein